MNKIGITPVSNTQQWDGLVAGWIHGSGKMVPVIKVGLGGSCKDGA